MISRFLLALFAATILSGCAAPALTVVQDKQFAMMSRHMHRELEKRGLLNAGHVCSIPFFGAQAARYGDVLFRTLSPSFMLGECEHVYLGGTFKETMQPDSRLKLRENGFSIEHATQTLDMEMIAIADWNGDGKKEWIVSCFVHPKRAGRDRTFYLLVPPPLSKGEVLKGTIAAVWECYGAACSLHVRDTKSIERDPDALAPKTDVSDVAPGAGAVTTPPDTSRSSGSSVQEHSL